MKIVYPDKWLPCDGIVLEEAANTAVRCSDRHVLVIAGPGAGKTELLAQKAAFLFQTNQCKETQKILEAFAASFIEGREIVEPVKDFTRGHFRRGVE